MCPFSSVGQASLFVFLGELDMVEPTTDKGEISVESKERMLRYGRGEGESMEDDSGWSEPRIEPLDIQSMAFAANHCLIDHGHKYMSQVRPAVSHHIDIMRRC